MEQTLHQACKDAPRVVPLYRAKLQGHSETMIHIFKFAIITIAVAAPPASANSLWKPRPQQT